MHFTCHVFWFCCIDSSDSWGPRVFADEGSVTFDRAGQESDPVAAEAMRAQIANFGQTPSQLVTTPHPARAAVPGSSPLSAGGGRLFCTAVEVEVSPSVGPAAAMVSGRLCNGPVTAVAVDGGLKVVCRADLTASIALEDMQCAAAEDQRDQRLLFGFECPAEVAAVSVYHDAVVLAAAGGWLWTFSLARRGRPIRGWRLTGASDGEAVVGLAITPYSGHIAVATRR